MSLPITEQTLIAYVRRELTQAQIDDINARAENDSALRARLEQLNDLFGSPSPNSAPTNTAPANDRTRSPSKKKVVVVAIAVILAATLLGAAGYAGYRAHAPETVIMTVTKEVRVEVPPAPPPRPTPPLFEDDFADEKLNDKKWALDRIRPKVRVMDGYVRLSNRGSLVTQQAFNEPIELSFDWTWSDLDEVPLYSENLNVVLHTTGQHQPVHSFEVKDGLAVIFSTIEGRVLVDVAEPSKIPNRTFFRRLNQSPKDSTIFAADKRYHIRITDTGKKVAVFVSGGKIAPKYATTPVVEVEYNEKFTDHRIAIYNREFVAGVRHESHIRNFKVRRLPD